MLIFENVLRLTSFQGDFQLVRKFSQIYSLCVDLVYTIHSQKILHVQSQVVVILCFYVVNAE